MLTTLLIWIGLALIVGLILNDPNQELAKVQSKSAERALLIVSPLFILYLFMGLFVTPLMIFFVSILEWIINFIVGWFE